MKGIGAGIAVFVVLFGCGGSSTLPPIEGSGPGNGTGSGSGGGSSSGSGSGSSSGSGSGSSSGGSSGCSASGAFTVQGVMSDSATGNPVVGASVCLLSCPSSCVTTDATGAYSANVPANGSGIVASMTGYVTEAWPMTPVANGTYNAQLRTPALIGTFAQQAQATFDGTTGAILFELFDGSGNPLAGATVSSGGGGTLAYFNTAGVLDPTLTASTTKGSGFVFQLPGGTTNLTVALAGTTCAHNSLEGWPATLAGATTSAPIAANQVTIARVTCQ